MSCSTVASGLSMVNTMASHTSPRLWGGILVAIPTAIPSEPFTRRLGNFEGSTVGSFREPSKLSMKSTVSLSRSKRRSDAIFDRRASV